MERKRLISVLGGGRDKQTGILIESSIARLNAAAQNFSQQNCKPDILVMGGHLKSYTPEAGIFPDSGADLRRNFLINKLRIPAKKIISIPIDARDTISEALITRDVAKEHQPPAISISTSMTHMPRAMAIFEIVFEPIKPPITIYPITNPPSDQLNPDQEIALTRLTRNFFTSQVLPDTFPGWEAWFREHQDFYQEQQEIHAQFKATGKASKGAYESIHD